jgi:hypothetical protein
LIVAEELELPVKGEDVAPLFSALAGGGPTVKNLPRAGLRFKFAGTMANLGLIIVFA